MPKSLRFLLMCYVGVLLCSCGQSVATRWKDVYDDIAVKYPLVPQMSIEELEKRLEGDDVPIVIDVRSDAEYAMSHLADAVHANNKASIKSVIDRSSHRDIVLYCSVGYRSCDFASLIGNINGRKIYNLKGSVFAWVNSGRPVYRDGHQVTITHPYNEDWRRLLNPEYWPKQD